MKLTPEEHLTYARRYVEYAKTHTPNFGESLVNSLLGISNVVEAIPVSLISLMDLDTFLYFALDFERLKKRLSEKGLEKEAMLADKISKDIIHRYEISHPI